MRPFADQHVQRRWNRLQRMRDHITLRGECAREPVQCRDGRDDVVALSVERADEGVESPEQITDLRTAIGESDVERADDVADLTQTTAVDHRGQSRQCLLGRRVGR